jgi:hypothetical protein
MRRSRKMSLRRGDAFIASLLLTSVFLLGCEPLKVMKDYFGAQGLNPLAALRSDVGAGALILKQRDKTIFAESIFDYSTGQKPAVTTKDLASIELNGVLEKYGQDRQVTGSKAADFLKSILATKITTDLGLTDNAVKIDLRDVKTSSLKPTDIQNYLRKNSSGLWNFIATQPNASEPYVVYEAYSADTVSISTEPGTDVSTKIAVSPEFRALSSVDPSFSYKRESRETILIKANRPYVFAVRTARLLIRSGVYALEFTNFAPREMKPAGGNEQFSTSVLDGYSPIKLEPVKSLI